MTTRERELRRRVNNNYKVVYSLLTITMITGLWWITIGTVPFYLRIYQLLQEV